MSKKDSIINELSKPQSQDEDTLSVVGVFGEKSKAADMHKDNLTKKLSDLNEDELMDVIETLTQGK